MKLQPDRISSANVISGYTPQHIAINGQPWTQSMLVPWAGEVGSWDVTRFDEMSAGHLASVAQLAPELVIIGTGARQRFLRPDVLRPLIEARIGFEIMDTAAACRTYNILVSEGRSVVAALLLEIAG
ncbi:Mth938-like domain-containing protein [Caldimonas tepidiphila]|uniref:Mth938-like domain-containing protein n=1 Tax=Caldimonas tepidiphila TaxID=2315841 RepID=UPI000E5AEF34|nr:Mth938-like domain-containing protein [Caldimonas tepidiphila]